jgi:(2R)-sulfolactate sulfo-lyase subunit alpha
MAKPHLLIHDKEDNVGVVVIEGLTEGTEMLCVLTADDSEFTLVSKQDVPIGHKIALCDLSEGDTILKYGENIARVIADVKKGEHVHVHNIKTNRW